MLGWILPILLRNISYVNTKVSLIDIRAPLFYISEKCTCKITVQYIRTLFDESTSSILHTDIERWRWSWTCDWFWLQVSTADTPATPGRPRTRCTWWRTTGSCSSTPWTPCPTLVWSHSYLFYAVRILILLFSAIPKDKVCESSPIELNIVAYGQWNLGKLAGPGRDRWGVTCHVSRGV